MPKISETLQCTFIGGGDGTKENPYTQPEFNQMCDSGHWLGGYVEEMGYVSMEITITPSGSYTPMSGTFITAADLLAESNANAQSGFLGDLIDNLTGVIRGTDKALDSFNAFLGDENLADYFLQNPQGQLYATDKTYSGGLGVEVHQISYYDENGTLIATRIYRE